MKQLITVLLLLLVVSGCRTSKTMKEDNTGFTPVNLGEPEKVYIGNDITGKARSPQVFIYKTKADYNDNVPVILNSDRTKIVSYPAPVDLVYGGKLRVPTPLADGWLLDNKGIGPDVAFLSYTYEEYSKMEQPPTMQELMDHLISKDPLTAWRFCGPRAEFTDMVPQLNEMIENNFRPVQ